MRASSLPPVAASDRSVRSDGQAYQTGTQREPEMQTLYDQDEAVMTSVAEAVSGELLPAGSTCSQCVQPFPRRFDSSASPQRHSSQRPTLQPSPNRTDWQHFSLHRVIGDRLLTSTQHCLCRHDE